MESSTKAELGRSAGGKERGLGRMRVAGERMAMEISPKWEEEVGRGGCQSTEHQGSKDHEDHKEIEDHKELGKAEENTEAKASESSNETHDEEAEGQSRRVPEGEQILQRPQRKRPRHREPPVQIPAVDASAAAIIENADAATPGSSLGDIWKLLPEELFDIIPSRLPFASQHRFRCVGKKWRGLRSVPPSHATLSKLEDQRAGFYCEAERKWFRLPPCNPPTRVGKVLKDVEGEVIDVNGGIVCYRNIEGPTCCYWVCNPLGLSTVPVIFPNHFIKDPRKPPKVKLLLDRTNKTFKLVVIQNKVSWTGVFDSTTLRWSRHVGGHSYLRSLEFFLWDNVVYAFSTKPKLGHRGRMVTAFNTESGMWTEIEVVVPPSGFGGVPTHQFFASDNNQLILVHFWYRKRELPCFSVWKLLGSSISSDNQYVKWDRWQNIIHGLEGAEVDFAGHLLTSVCCGPEYMCFGFRGIRDDDLRTHKCVRYSFAAKTWSMMQCPGTRGWGGNSALYNWEPNLDLDFSY